MLGQLPWHLPGDEPGQQFAPLVSRHIHGGQLSNGVRGILYQHGERIHVVVVTAWYFHDLRYECLLQRVIVIVFFA